ncbi:hypothetical protein B566_EDAN011504 [Ephemera danica]|nr:hypothetical protein B566_EDAN011504 [Ephemera danica]
MPSSAAYEVQRQSNTRCSSIGSFTLFDMAAENKDPEHHSLHKGSDYGNGHHIGPAVDLETAIKETGYGIFHFWLLMVCGCVYMCCAIGTTTLSFVLPAAECDFQMTSADKGELNATPLVGMIVGSYIWGSMADTRGRKMVLVVSLMMDFFAALASSLVPNFPLFLCCRFFNGVGIIGATSVVFPYMSEFLAYKHRDLNLCRLEIFWVLGVCAVPALAWLIIPLPLEWEPVTGSVFRSWRVFVFLCGAPSLLVALVLRFCFPETPKFLLSRSRHDEAMTVLRSIFYANTRQNVVDYNVKRLAAETGHLALNDDGSPMRKASLPDEAPLLRRIVRRLVILWQLNVQLFSGSLLKYTLVACFIDFGIMSSYYTLMLWFPELLERFSTYQHLHGEDTVILLVSVSFMTTAGIAVLGLHLVRNEMENLVLSCVFEALASVAEATLFCAVVHIFPTHLRALAVSLTVTCGRIGAVLGNVLFGLLLDLSCAVPITTFGVLLIASGLLCLALPRPPPHTSSDLPRQSICSHAL